MRNTGKPIVDLSARNVRRNFSLRKLIRFVRYFSNWPEVWSAYRNRQPLPSLHVRGGVILTHGDGDDPLYLFREIFERREYIGDGFYTPEPGHVVVDIGANIGFFALFMQWLAPGIRVYCFEPAPDTFEQLRANISANNAAATITAYPYAVAGSNGSGFMTARTNSMLRSLDIDSDEIGNGDRVQTLTLARALELCGQERINLLKIDIEGGEVELMSAAEPGTLDRVDRVVAEIHQRRRPESPRIVREALEAAGFRKLEIFRPHPGAFGIIRASR